MSKAVLILSCGLILALGACSRQQSDWEKSRAANTADAYEQFLKRYPHGEFSQQAEARVKELYEERDWQKARDFDTQDAYLAFLKQHPQGRWSEEARIRVENFNLAQAPGGTSPADSPASASGVVPPQQAAVRTPSPAGKPAGSPAPSSGTAKSYAVQLGAFKSEKAAMRRWKHLQKSHADLLSGRSPTVSRGKTGAGELYRLQLAALSGTQARAFCAALKAKAQACLLIPPARRARTRG